MSTNLHLGMVDHGLFQSECLKPLRDYRYSTVLTKSTREDESDIYCGLNSHMKPTHDCLPIPERYRTSFDMLCDVAGQVPNADHLGVREKLVDSKGKEILGEYKWTSMKQSIDTIRIIGSALISEPGLIVEACLNDDNIKNAKFLGIWATNCPYWLLTDYASIAYGLVTVPLYETLGDDALLTIFEDTRMSTICIDSSKLLILLKLKGRIKHIRNLIVFDKLSDEDVQKINDLGLHHVLMDDLVMKYRDNVVEPPARKREDVATLIYTSGTGGVPKGAVHTNASIMALTHRVSVTGNRFRIQRGFTLISYLPLSHVYQRFVEHYCSVSFGRIGYFGGNIRNLLDDMHTLKPDVLVGVPRVFTKILERINGTIDGKPRLLKRLIRWVARRKSEIVQRYPENPHHRLYDIIMRKIKEPFGGRITSIVLGSASMADTDIKDLQNFMTCPVSEGWGTTEVGVCFIQDYRDPHKGTIGGPIGDVIFKIRSIPEMEYNARANPPRGELLIKASGIMLGYLGRPDLTAEVLDSDGWYHTGDVVELQPNMSLKILDRARNFFKLSQGEYIAPEKLENLYIRSPYVEQIFIYGESKRNHIVSIVVVNVEAVKGWASLHNKAGTPISTLLGDPDLIDEVCKSFKEIAEKEGLNSLEKLKVFTLIEEPFSTQNGMLTPTFKTVRKQVRTRYETEINAMYSSERRSRC